jgi:4-methyl-5(b-hydroxyethyl)-thiazole monophosphate biosynthesis
MPKKVIVLLAEGFEEVEAVTPIDYLRRAGIEVTIAAVGNDLPKLAVNGVHDIELCADTFLNTLLNEGKLDASLWDAVVIPGGGPGADRLAASKEAGAFIKGMAQAGKWVCAICASPARVLAPLGILNGKKYTCFPGEEEKIIPEASGSPLWAEDRVVVDSCFITSRSAGTAGEFSCAIIEKLVSREEAEKLADRIFLLRP